MTAVGAERASSLPALLVTRKRTRSTEPASAATIG
jgi:hypothetical protein